MSDPVSMAVCKLGRETDWAVDVIKSRGRYLIIDKGVVVGEILGDGTRVDFPKSERFAFEMED